MNRCLLLNKTIVEELGMDKEQEHESDYEEESVDPLIKLFYGGKVFIIPSFFKLILNLRKQKREFAIVFRTFGSDGTEIELEFNRFCEGTHPCYNGKNGTPLARFDGSKGTKDMRLELSNTGYIRRTSDNHQDVILVLGTSEKAPEGSTEDEFHAGQVDEGSVTIDKSLGSFHIRLNELLNRTSALNLRDDYGIWNLNGEVSQFGKVIPVDQQDYSTHHIFFDDNIEEFGPSCVDVRDLVTGDVIPTTKALGKFAVKVDSFRAIVDPDYFIKELEATE
jgi:hypothetical protein